MFPVSVCPVVARVARRRHRHRRSRRDRRDADGVVFILSDSDDRPLARVARARRRGTGGEAVDEGGRRSMDRSNER